MGDQEFLILLNIEQIASIIPAILSIIKYKNFTIALKILSWHLIFTIIIQVIVNLLRYLHTNNLFLAHIDVLEQFILFSLLYGHILNEQIKKKWVIATIVAFTLFAIVNAIFWQPLTIFPSNTNLIKVIAVSFYIVFALYIRSKQIAPKKFINARDYILNKVPFFFINIGLLLSCITSLIVYYLSNDLLDPHLHSLALKVWGLHAVSNIILNILISIGLLLFKRPKNLVLTLFHGLWCHRPWKSINMLNSVITVQVSDTTMFNSSNKLSKKYYSSNFHARPY